MSGLNVVFVIFVWGRHQVAPAGNLSLVDTVLQLDLAKELELDEARVFVKESTEY